jgi:hypothetical protein
MDFETLFQNYKTNTLSGRYITLDNIEPILQQLNTNNQLEVVGQSVLNRPIYAYTIGQGATKILMWSQMHGN